MQRLMQVWVLAVLLGVTACATETKSGIPGIYTGSYLGGEETFEIRTDGTFTQTFTKGGKEIYSSKGKWEQVLSEDGKPLEGFLRFAPFVQADCPDDGEGKPRALEEKYGSWSVPDKVIFDEDRTYWVLKGWDQTDSLPWRHVAGIYEGKYAGGLEVFDLCLDGTFSQVFTKGGKRIYSNKGIWSFEKVKGFQDDHVRFVLFMEPDYQNVRGGKPVMNKMGLGSWSTFPVKIIFDDDLGYWVVKR